MILELLDQEDFEDLPEEGGPRWIALEKLARERLAAVLATPDTGERTKKNLILQYMKVITVLAEEAGIQGISIPSGNEPASQIDSFMISVQGVAARVWMNNRSVENRFGISVSAQAKIEIRSLVSNIHSQIPSLNLSDRQQFRLISSLKSFSDELELPKARFSVGSGHLVAALTVLNLSVTTVAEGPSAFETIQRILCIWGEQKEENDSARLRIPYTHSPKMLPSPSKQIASPKDAS